MQQLQPILSRLSFKTSNVVPVQGGDINKAYCLHTADNKYFLKVNDAARHPGMFEKEATGLKALARYSTFHIPEVIAFGAAGNLQYLMLEWLEPGDPDAGTWKTFGQQLAQMHSVTYKLFGFTDNYLGTYLQKNTWTATWPEFYAAYRILPLTRLLHDEGQIEKDVVVQAENFYGKMGNLFPDEKPALLHGDLWNGNFITLQNSRTALIDPAVYYGHREMDIGMTKLFGGFDNGFYDSYNATNPLVKGWEHRLPYTQLYPLLFHAWVFGGSYISRVKEILKRF